VHQLCVGFKKAYDSATKKVFGIYMKLLRLIKMCLNYTYGRVRVGKRLSDTFPITNGFKPIGALSSMSFNSAAECAIGRVQVNQDDLKFKWYTSASGLYR